jgi:putative ABC transport system substrate-binding protein
MTRRTLLASVLAACVPLAALAQPASTVHRVGILAQDLQPGLLETFRDELGTRGYVAGKNITIELRNAAGRTEQLPVFATQLLQLKVDVILAINTPAALAAQKATSTVPIVFLRVADPVKAGLVRSLAHPGGNVTGVSFLPDELGAKGLQTLREVVPNVTRIAALYKADNPGGLLVVTETERRSAPLGLRPFVRLPVRDPSDFPAAFDAARRARSEALFVMDDGAITKLRNEIVKLATSHSLPVVSIYRDFAEAGGLIAYGPNLPEVYRRGAQYVERLLKGAKPADLPVEEPTKFELVINLKTAKTLGLTIPPSVQLRADHIVQ